MRNLKKVLALALALVMTLSVMSFASAASSYKDASSITEKYRAAVEVLEALQVFKGDDNDNFNPQDGIERAQAAAVIYRIVTGDVEDEQLSLYADWNKFDDVKSTDWFAGYVNYCANAGIIKGYDNGNFGPYDKVTGYQMLAMILRAVGYGQNGEYTGADWAINTASDAKELGLTAKLSGTGFNSAMPREQVAEVAFEALQMPIQRYTALNGYVNKYANVYTTPSDAVAPATQEMTLGYLNFKLLNDTADGTDDYGRPGVEYYLDTSAPYNTKGTLDSADKMLTIVTDTPVKTYYTEVTECQVAKDVNKDKSFNAVVYLNGTEAVDAAIAGSAKAVTVTEIDNGHTTATIGAQGRTTEVYKRSTVAAVDSQSPTPQAVTDAWTIVYVDTFLAEVSNVKAATYDTAGHEITPATMTLTVADLNGATVTLNSVANKDGYKNNDLVLVTTYGDASNSTATDNFTTTKVTNAVDIVGTPNVVTVTASGVHSTGGTTSNQVTTPTYDGVIAGGKTYLANKSYTTGSVKHAVDVTSGSSKTAITVNNTMIGQNWTLYLDSKDNIVGAQLANSLTENGGIILTYKYEDYGVNDYGVTVKLMLVDGTTTTLKFVDPSSSNFFANAQATDANVGNGAFIRFHAVTLNGTTYYVTDEAATKYIDSDSKLESAKANALSGSTSGGTADTGTLVNDKTVFIVENFIADNSAGTPAYVQNTAKPYTIYKNGFKSINDIAKGGQTNLTYASLTVNGTQYVLVEGGESQTTPNTVAVDDSALFLSVAETYQEYALYNVVKNGKTDTVKVGINSTPVLGQINAYTSWHANGYYTVLTANSTNNVNGAGQIAASTSGTAKTEAYANGVLTVGTGSTPTYSYLTVADNVVVQIVNLKTEQVYAVASDAIGSTIAQYSGAAMEYTTDTHGYINYLYILQG